MKHKSYLDARVANELGMSSVRKARLVNVVTTEFIRQLRLLIAKNDLISVDGLGRFKVSRAVKKHKVRLTHGTCKLGGRKGTRTLDINGVIKVYFSKSAALKKLLEENSHE